MQNLKGLTTVFILLYSLFILLNLLEGIWYAVFTFGNGELDFLIRIKNYEGKLHFGMNILDYILHFVFLLFANDFVKKYNLGKGVRVLILLLAFLPIVNLFLLYIIWRKLNKQLFNYSGIDWLKSDRKIRAIWIMTLISMLYLVSVPLIMYYSPSPEIVSGTHYYLRFGTVAGRIYYLIVSIIYLFYFLELKRAMNKPESGANNLNYTSLLDD